MISLLVIMRDELADGSAERLLAKHYQAVQARFLDCGSRKFTREGKSRCLTAGFPTKLLLSASVRAVRVCGTAKLLFTVPGRRRGQRIDKGKFDKLCGFVESG